MDKKITKLAIFDFDGTLIDTPLPEEGKVVYLNKTGQKWPHRGWWSQPMSLDMKIFDIQAMPEVVADYEKEKAKDNICVVMLTGRLAKMDAEVKAVLDAKGLTFDEYHYNTGGSTDMSKRWTMEKLLKKYPEATEIEMWDDRVEHVPIFEEWGKNQCLKGKLQDFSINVVPSGRHQALPFGFDNIGDMMKAVVTEEIIKPLEDMEK